jgi:hypothetical protein
MLFAAGPYRAMASPPSLSAWSVSKSPWMLSSRPLLWAGAALKRFVANMGVARLFLPGGCRSVPALQAALQRVRCKSQKRRPLCTAGRLSTVVVALPKSAGKVLVRALAAI